MAKKVNCEKNGTNYYRITATVGRGSDGKPIRREFYGTCKTDAEAKRDEYINGVKDGLNLDFKDALLGELMHSWLYEVVRIRVKPSSFEKYEGLYRNYIKESDLYGCKLYTIKSLQLQRHYNKLHDNCISSNIIKNTNKLLKSFFNYAVDEGYLLKNPCLGKKIVIPGINELEDKEIEIFTNAEIKKLKTALKEHRLKCLILMALGTGLRQGELLALQWEDIDLVKKTVTVEKSIKRVKIVNADETSTRQMIVQTPKSKNGKRIVPLPSKLIPIINEHKTMQETEKVEAGPAYFENNYVFTTSIGTPTNAKNLFKSYKSILSNANIPHKKFHALRHTYATKLFEAEVSLKTVSELLGHGDISMTADIYTHVMPRQKNKAAEKLNNLFV